ncbi:cyclic nucleotide-binding domain-containing protein [Candidatus Viridilinea mediisalina]|nr:cyclic nucleotide-binding domain-containing protein [Candidatus Viridilinea mediisalina]
MSGLVEHLRRVEIFSGLSDEELLQLATICKPQRLPPETIIFEEGADGNELMIILHGSVRISINTRLPNGTFSVSTINVLYVGQSFGEMVLLGGATRSATVSTVDTCTLVVIQERDFAMVCERNPRIGYRVMRNMASDLAYKLRSSNLLLRGNIRWQQGELGKQG